MLCRDVVDESATQTQATTDPFLIHLHSLLSYSHANRAVLKLRDQKQMDFEELSNYLSNLTSERDRLAAVVQGRAGSTGLGLSAYIKDKVDALRGADDDRSRVERMGKLDGKIREVEIICEPHYASGSKMLMRFSAARRCDNGT